jgi:CopG family transcriptional regulator, nickel-responsive regulator
MAGLSRIGVAIDSDLLEQFDALNRGRGYGSRSEAFRDLIRDALINQAAGSDDTPVVGTITLLYDHHQRTLSDRLTAVQHESHHSMLSTLHVHLDHDHCLEVVVVRGRAGEVRHIADALISMKGVKHGRLTLTGPTTVAAPQPPSRLGRRTGPRRRRR